MDTDDLEDWQKSHIFALLLERLVEDSENKGLYGLRTWEPFDDKGNTFTEFPVPDFYDPKKMQYAWRVLNWAMWEPTAKLADLSRRLTVQGVFGYPPHIAQRTWLDAILKLAVEEKMVEWQKLPFKLTTA